MSKPTARARSIDPRVAELRQRFVAGADAKNAAYQRAYHKSPLRFHGLSTPAWREAFRAVFPARPRLEVDVARALAAQFWASDWMEDRTTAIALLSRVAADLDVGDLVTLRAMTHACHGWALLDGLATGVLGPLAMARGDAVYRRVRTWSKDRDLWTRRASVLVHVIPARRGELRAAWAWPTFEELLPETDFFLRKAVGWTLREASRRYPREVRDFLVRVGDRASGLTRREGSRNLPPEYRLPAG